jgi:hypothetical protein
MRRVMLAAVLGLMIGATDRAEAGQILTYTYGGQASSSDGNFVFTISGSFQVDSDHIGTSGITDITSFITNLSFTTSAFASIPSFTFDAATGFEPQHVTVTPSGDFSTGSLFAGGSAPSDGDSGTLIVLANEMQFQGFTLDDADLGGLVGEGNFDWTHTLLLGAAVPEPASLVLAIVGALMLGVRPGFKLFVAVRQ